ncbi:MAG: hypothetical protein WCA35_28340 [Kovacikia sp.]
MPFTKEDFGTGGGEPFTWRQCPPRPMLGMNGVYRPINLAMLVPTRVIVL